jgi:hypothetical protein
MRSAFRDFSFMEINIRFVQPRKKNRHGDLPNNRIPRKPHRTSASAMRSLSLGTRSTNDVVKPISPNMGWLDGSSGRSFSWSIAPGVDIVVERASSPPNVARALGRPPGLTYPGSSTITALAKRNLSGFLENFS